GYPTPQSLPARRPVAGPRDGRTTKASLEQKWSKRIKASPPGLPLVRGAGRDVNITVGDPGVHEQFLVSLQGIGILFRTATEEEDVDLLVELSGIGHGAVVDRLEVEGDRRGRGWSAAPATPAGRGPTAEQSHVR